jgi:hypothetical protein
MLMDEFDILLINMVIYLDFIYLKNFVIYFLFLDYFLSVFDVLNDGLEILSLMELVRNIILCYLFTLF